MPKNLVSACLGKEAFSTGAEAAKAAKAIAQRKNHAHGLTHYRCDYCNRFHIGHGGKSLGLHRPIRRFTVLQNQE